MFLERDLIAIAVMATSNDVPMADAATAKANGTNTYADLLQTPHTDAFAFSETEQLALQLNDELRELELEKSLLEAHVNGTSSPLSCAHKKMPS